MDTPAAASGPPGSAELAPAAASQPQPRGGAGGGGERRPWGRTPGRVLARRRALRWVKTPRRPHGAAEVVKTDALRGTSAPSPRLFSQEPSFGSLLLLWSLTAAHPASQGLSPSSEDAAGSRTCAPPRPVRSGLPALRRTRRLSSWSSAPHARSSPLISLVLRGFSRRRLRCAPLSLGAGAGLGLPCLLRAPAQPSTPEAPSGLCLGKCGPLGHVQV